MYLVRYCITSLSFTQISEGIEEMTKENMSKLGIHRVTCLKYLLNTFKKLDWIGTNILTPPLPPPHTHT